MDTIRGNGPYLAVHRRRLSSTCSNSANPRGRLVATRQTHLCHQEPTREVRRQAHMALGARHNGFIRMVAVLHLHLL